MSQTLIEDISQAALILPARRFPASHGEKLSQSDLLMSH
jgi:hypothetical protein